MYEHINRHASQWKKKFLMEFIILVILLTSSFDVSKIFLFYIFRLVIYFKISIISRISKISKTLNKMITKA